MAWYGLRSEAWKMEHSERMSLLYSCGFISVSDNTRRKQSESHLGKKHSEERKQKMRESHAGQIPWNKGKIGVFSEEVLQKNRESHLGIRHSEESIRRGAERQKLMFSCGFRSISDEQRRKRSEIAASRVGPLAPRWQGGISFEPYGLEFNVKLKEQIRERDGCCCCVCGVRENGIRLSVHHIDYDKQNNVLSNLISLCVNCHIKTNSNRDVWQAVLEAIDRL